MVKNILIMLVLIMSCSSGGSDRGNPIPLRGGTSNTEKEKEDFIQSVKAGNLEEVKKFISKFDSIKGIHDKDRYNLLHIAADKEEVKILEELVKKYPELLLEEIGTYKTTPLSIFENKFDMSFVIYEVIAENKEILEAIKDVRRITGSARSMSWGGQTIVSKSSEKIILSISSHKSRMVYPIRVAVEEGKADIVKFLLDNGAHPYQTNYRDRRTLLMIAAEEGHKDVAAKIINKDPGTLISISESNRRAVDVAIEEGHLELVEFLLDEEDKYKKGLDSGEYDQVENIEFDKNYFKKQEEQIKEGFALHYTPLMVAVREEKIDMVEMLIEKRKKDINRSLNNKFLHYQGKTALHIAVEKGNVEIVKLLTNAGIDVNKEDKDGKKAIDYTQAQKIKEILNS